MPVQYSMAWRAAKYGTGTDACAWFTPEAWFRHPAPATIVCFVPSRTGVGLHC
jgi:hypothetical protein